MREFSAHGILVQKRPPLAFILNIPFIRPVITTRWPQWLRDAIFGRPHIFEYRIGVKLGGAYIGHIVEEDRKILGIENE